MIVYYSSNLQVEMLHKGIAGIMVMNGVATRCYNPRFRREIKAHLHNNLAN